MSEKEIIFDLNMYSGGHDGGQKMRVLCALINDARFGIICLNSCYIEELKLVCEFTKSGEPFTLTIKHCKSKDGKHLKIPAMNISLPKASKQVEVTKVIVGF